MASRITRSPISPVLTLRVGTILLVLLLWEALSRSGLGLQELFPSIGAVVGSAWDQVSSGRLNPHLLASASEVGAGFAIGTVLGLAVALPVGANDYLRRVFEPLIVYSGVVPLLILFPIFLLMFGIGPNSKTAMAALSAFFPIAMNTIGAFYQVRPIYVRVARVLRLNRWQLYTEVYLPAMLGMVLVGLRLGMGVAIIGALLAETKIARAGLGYLAMDYYSAFRITEMYAVLLIVFLIAGALNLVVDLLITRLLHYRTRNESSQFF